MPAAEAALPIDASEAARLFAPLAGLPRLVLAVSGGPDSTALLVLAAEQRRVAPRFPDLLAVTVDHRLRPEAAAEAEAVAGLAAGLGVPHRTLAWIGDKPADGLMAAARAARYGLIADAAAAFGAFDVATAHTLDDQAETVLLRLAAGSGPAGLAAMRAVERRGPIRLHRPFLAVAKARLVATLADAACRLERRSLQCRPALRPAAAAGGVGGAGARGPDGRAAGPARRPAGAGRGGAGGRHRRGRSHAGRDGGGRRHPSAGGGVCRAAGGDRAAAARPGHRPGGHRGAGGARQARTPAASPCDTSCRPRRARGRFVAHWPAR